MAEALDLLHKWQDLAAAGLTAIAALSVAFLMSHRDRHREDISAAMVLVANLTSVISANETLIALSKKEKTEEDSLPLWMAQRLVSYRPALSPLFDGCVARLMYINVKLAVHLDLFTVIYRSVERHLDRLNEDLAHFRLHERLLRSKADMEEDASLVGDGFARAAKHAECAERLLSQLVLSRWRTVHRLRLVVWRHALDKECNTLLTR